MGKDVLLQILSDQGILALLTMFFGSLWEIFLCGFTICTLEWYLEKHQVQINSTKEIINKTYMETESRITKLEPEVLEWRSKLHQLEQEKSAILTLPQDHLQLAIAKFNAQLAQKEEQLGRLDALKKQISEVESQM